jgi:outer membrane protein
MARSARVARHRSRAVAALLAGLGLAPLTVPGADLLTIFRDAQTADATFRSARAAYNATQEKLPQGRALLLPTATLSANTNYNDRRIDFRNNTSAPGQFNSNGVTLSLSQPIYRRQNTVQYEQARNQVAQSEVVLSQAAQDLVVRAAQAYFDVLLAQDNLELAGTQKAAISEQLAQAKRNFEVGTSTITDTHEAQARFDLTVSQEIAARNELEIKRRALQLIIAREPGAIAPLRDAIELRLPDPPVMDRWVEEAEGNAYPVVVSRFAFDIAKQEVLRARGAHYPTLDAVASYSESSTGAGLQGGVGNDTTSKIIGLQLSVPLYQGGAIQSRVREALANEEKARQDLESARRTAALAARQSFLGVVNGTEQVKALGAALVSTRSQLESTKLGQQVGVRTSVDVLNAQQQFFTARRDLAQARYATILNQLRLKASVARLDETDIGAINGWLER